MVKRLGIIIPSQQSAKITSNIVYFDFTLCPYTLHSLSFAERVSHFLLESTQSREAKQLWTPIQRRSKNTEQPQYEEINTGHLNQAGPSGVDGITGNLTSSYVNVPTSGRTETETDPTSDPTKQYQPLNVM